MSYDFFHHNPALFTWCTASTSIELPNVFPPVWGTSTFTLDTWFHWRFHPPWKGNKLVVGLGTMVQWLHPMALQPNFRWINLLKHHRLWSKFWIICKPRSKTTIRPTSAYKEGCRELQLTQTKPIEDITSHIYLALNYLGHLRDSPSPHFPPCFRKNGWKETLILGCLPRPRASRKPNSILTSRWKIVVPSTNHICFKLKISLYKNH